MIPLLYSKSKFMGVFFTGLYLLEGMELNDIKYSLLRILIKVDENDLPPSHYFTHPMLSSTNI